MIVLAEHGLIENGFAALDDFKFVSHSNIDDCPTRPEQESSTTPPADCESQGKLSCKNEGI